ncbi:MAG: hypothetical protein ABR530_01390 [Pyrinomonadaceae bacterium]
MYKKINDKFKTTLVAGGAAILVYTAMSAAFSDPAMPTVSAQTDQFLARRIDQIEQRFYSIESRINRMESQTRSSVIAPRITDNNDTEIQFLRSQIDGLRLRLGEVECGLLRVDERTLPGAGRQARNRAGAASTEPCRREPGSAVQLSARPGQ